MSDSYKYTTEVVDSESQASAAAAPVGLQLADYELSEKIGAGGYGEVWKAIGPGGLPKAVKILYGERNGEHAEAELKALERMRELRHPFLLNIERIEVVDSRLIVVSELADGSLTDRFSECREKGLTGIPRDELLGYLRDAADALDFMAEQHGLQHLDIKPDNLLLQGGHAKVGDFGLAKDLNAADVSAVSGFTPTFAAPELFEGRPDRSTDQYSLAIVYQMMLTGAPPFSGRTPAQLTVQHLRSQPDLTNLQPVDRPVVARALSKNVNSRFDNCRHFVDELARRKVSRNTNRTFAALNSVEDSDSGTLLLQTQGAAETQAVEYNESDLIDFKTADAAQHKRRRCVVIGAGGLAGEVLSNLKQQLQQDENAPSAPILYFDTDRQAARQLNKEGGISPDETVIIPLRSSKDYKKRRGLDLSWMSRRWLFNIPKSEQVQGIRPLGRLALCDHYADVKKSIIETLKSVERDMSDDEELDIYVVASIFGGTGSGVVNDLGLMVQSAARKLKRRNARVLGVLLHGTGSTRNVTDVQEANTLATLKELRHLMTPGLQTKRGFEESMVMRDTAPFDETYFLHLGDSLSDVTLGECLPNVVNYLRDSITSDAQADFYAWCDQSKDSVASATQLRLLGSGSQDVDSYRTAADQSGNLVSMLLRRWVAAIDAGKEVSPKELPEELADTKNLLAELKLSADSSREQVMSLLRGPIGKQVETLSTQAFAIVSQQCDLATATQDQIVDCLGRLASEQTKAEGATLLTIISQVQKTLAGAAENRGKRLVQHLRSLLDTPSRFEGAVASSKWLTARLRETEAAGRKQLSQMESMFSELISGSGSESAFVGADGETGPKAIQAFCKEYCVLLAYQAIYQCYNRHLESVINSIGKWDADLDGMRTEMAELASKHADPSQLSTETPQAVIEAIDRRLRMDAPMLFRKLSTDNSRVTQLRKQLMNSTTGFLMAAMSPSNGDRSGAGDSAAFPANAWPGIRGIGGRRRVLGILPEGVSEAEWRSTLREEFGDCVAVRTESRPTVSVVCEIEGVPIESLLSRLTCNNPHVEEVAQRVHTRVDIDW